jgi:hypothetical protein
MISRLHIVLLALAGMLSMAASAQPYGNEWINYEQTYFKISVAEEGIYRITYNDLQAAGFPLGAVDPRRIQIFHRGVEQAIFIQGEADAQFNPTDFIEFYGRKNDGTLDAPLYKPSNLQPHSYYNLFSDTTAYFLTWNLAPFNGKRAPSFFENNVTNIPAQIAHTEERLTVLTDRYAVGRTVGSFIIYSHFDQGEGWTGLEIARNNFRDYTLTSLANGVAAQGKPQLEVLLVGRNNFTHRTEVLVGASAATLRSLGTIDFQSFETALFSRELEWSDISGTGNMVVRIRSLGVEEAADLISTSFLRMRYPQAFQMNNAPKKNFFLRPDATNKSYIVVQNIPVGARIWDVTDPANGVRIGSNTVGNSLNAIVPNTASARKLHISTPQSPPFTLKRVYFRPINASQPNYLILSHRNLMKPTTGYDNPVKAYGAYRASQAGGGYDTLVVDIQQVYDQFHYGEYSSGAIFNFMRYMVAGGKLKYFFILGKGIELSKGSNIGGVLRYYRQHPDLFTYKDLVPTAGTPASDIAFSAGLGDNPYTPAVATGRVVASTPADVAAYLNKVKEKEASPYDNLWKKNILHLSGGITQSELVRFNIYTEGFRAIAEAPYLGARVSTIAKSSSSVVELINVADEVNAGINILTSYGHSAPNIIDIDIGFVRDPNQGYNNRGKYPLLFVMGCNVGEFFLNTMTFSEDWLLAPDRGAIGVHAHSSFGFEGTLRNWGNFFYQTAYADEEFIHRPLGDVNKEVIRRFMAEYSSSPANLTVIQQMMLYADPAVRLFGAQLPDYALEEDGLFVQPIGESAVSANSSEFLLGFPVKNFGVYQTDSLQVSLRRTLANGQAVSYDSLYPPVLYLDTLYIKVSNTGLTAGGMNTFELVIDEENVVDEITKANNTARLEFLIPLNGTRNLMPFPSSIVNSPSQVLWAQTTDLFSPPRDIQFEMDTSFRFNSPFRKQRTVSARVLANWEVDLLPATPQNDSVVYYWRTRLASPEPGESADWQVSSFTFINGSPPGWSQTQFGQLRDNFLTGLTPVDLENSFEYEQSQRGIAVRTFGAAFPEWTPADIQLVIDDVQYIFPGRTCRNNTLNLVAFNRTTLSPYAVFPFDFWDARTCGRQIQVINNFTNAEITGANEWLRQFVDAVPEGDIVVAFTIGTVNMAAWPEPIRAKLVELGASMSTLNGITGGAPYILVGRKGSAPGTSIEQVAGTVPAAEQEISLQETLAGFFTSGRIRSPLIGPASSWSRLITRVKADPTEEASIELFGVDFEGNETLLQSGLTHTDQDLSNLSSSQYPYLRLRATLTDEVNFTPPKVAKWQVYYAPVPEGVLLPASGLSAQNQRQEGQLLQADFQFINISGLPFPDSLKTEYSTFNTDSRTTSRMEKNIEAPAPGDTTQFTLPIPTQGKVGGNDLTVFVNPRILPEQVYENNLLVAPNFLSVTRDVLRPVLDVTFDGQYLLDGDIVSPNPTIVIKLKDENPFLGTQDTTQVQLFLRRPCVGCAFERIPFATPGMHWFTNEADGSFQVEYKPGTLDDGLHTLRVQGQDASGNPAGEEPYVVNFEVVNASTVTHFYPYPNPFSTSTRFVFTLTGSKVPDYLKIQIMTVTGKVVREITQDEIGPLRIGNNMTEYAWDGRDEFGDQLANGVYLYRVLIKDNDMSFDHRKTSADKAFKHGYGKLYILR